MKALLICTIIIGTAYGVAHAAEPASFDITRWADDRVAAIEARIAEEKNGNDVKTCCHINGQCVVVERWKMCPRGYF